MFERIPSFCMKSDLTIIGTNHGKGVSRIWLDGNKLIEAGFHFGARYDLSALKADSASTDLKELDSRIELTLNPNGKFEVSGDGDSPTIDISGRVITDTFAKHIAKSHSSGAPVVEINYSIGQIIITAAGFR